MNVVLQSHLKRAPSSSPPAVTRALLRHLRNGPCTSLRVATHAPTRSPRRVLRGLLLNDSGTAIAVPLSRQTSARRVLLPVGMRRLLNRFRPVPHASPRAVMSTPPPRRCKRTTHARRHSLSDVRARTALLCCACVTRRCSRCLPGCPIATARPLSIGCQVGGVACSRARACISAPPRHIGDVHGRAFVLITCYPTCPCTASHCLAGAVVQVFRVCSCLLCAARADCDPARVQFVPAHACARLHVEYLQNWGTPLQNSFSVLRW